MELPTIKNLNPEITNQKVKNPNQVNLMTWKLKDKTNYSKAMSNQTPINKQMTQMRFQNNKLNH